MYWICHFKSNTARLIIPKKYKCKYKMNIEEQEKVLRNLFSSDISSLFKQKKELEYTYCIWGTSVLFEIYPFDMERKNIKRGRKLAKAPTKKSGKFQHFRC